MSYIVLNHITIDRRMDHREIPWQLHVVAVLMPELTLVDTVVWLDPSTWPDPRRYSVPNTMVFRKRFPRSPRGQYRFHPVRYNVILPPMETPLWRLRWAAA